MKEQIIKAYDGYELHLDIYEVKNPKGYVQVIHGMQEYKDRYDKLAKILNTNGYTVIVSNLRGHGKDAPLLNFFKEKEGYKYLLSDQKQITEYIFNTYNVDKVIIFAHSMGTIIARNLIKTESKNYSKVILTGYISPSYRINFGIFLSNLIISIKGPKYYSNFIENNVIKRFNKSIDNPKTEVDWISYNEENVKKYIEDKYCGNKFTVSGYNDIFYLMKFMTENKNLKDVNKELPILLLRGEDDPCIGGEKENTKSINYIKEFGFNNLQEIKYKAMRHEILNEINYEEVYKDIVIFLND